MGATTATAHLSPPGAARPAGAMRRSAAQLRLQPCEADDRLGVRRLRDQRLEVAERPHLDVDPLVLLVELAGRDLEQVGRADGLARLAHEPQLLAVQDDDPDCTGVDDDVALGVLAVLVAERLAADAEELALQEGLGVGALEGGAHADGCSAVVGSGSGSAAASSRSASATSSMPSSAATDTRSVGSWLRSVPLARFTHGKPPASRALASEPPPVAIRRGSYPQARSAASAAVTAGDDGFW